MMSHLVFILGIVILTGFGQAEGIHCITKEFGPQWKYSVFGGCNQFTGAGWKGIFQHSININRTSFVVRLRDAHFKLPLLVQRPECLAEIKLFVSDVPVKSVINDATQKMKDIRSIVIDL